MLSQARGWDLSKGRGGTCDDDDSRSERAKRDRESGRRAHGELGHLVLSGDGEDAPRHREHRDVFRDCTELDMKSKREDRKGWQA